MSTGHVLCPQIKRSTVYGAAYLNFRRAAATHMVLVHRIHCFTLKKHGNAQLTAIDNDNYIQQTLFVIIIIVTVKQAANNNKYSQDQLDQRS